MTAPVRRPAQIAVAAGQFASQQLAFAHLLDEADRARTVPDLDAIDVLQGAAPERRLAHYFDAATVASILNAAEDADTFVLMTKPCDFLGADTARLRWLGVFPGHLVRARPEAPC